MELTNLNKDRKVRRKPSIDLGNMVFGKVPPPVKGTGRGNTRCNHVGKECI